MNYFDLHCDTLFEVYCGRGNLRESENHISLIKAKKYNKYAQIFALFCGDKPLSEKAAESLLPALLNTAHNEFNKNSDLICLCKDKNEYNKALNHGKIAAFLSIEGAELVQSDKLLQQAYEGGVRFVTITWNHKNKYGSGAKNSNEGLSQEGKNFIKKIDEYGMICDVSHLSLKGFYDVCDATNMPFIASHSNSYDILNHVRNLTDDQFCEISKRHGLVGINIYSNFLSLGATKIEDILCHIDHFLTLGGEKSLSFGCDFDGCDKFPENIEDIRDVSKIYDMMLKLNYNEQLVQDIFFNNANEFINRMF